MDSLFHDNIVKSDFPAGGGTDNDVDAVVAWLEARAAAKGGGGPFYGAALRRTFDEVLDGPRTGRWDFDQLEKTEKTYVGTKLEIVLRTALELDRAFPMDLEIEGVPVDIKWSMQSVWQIPREAVGHVCLCIGGRADMAKFQVGVVRCRPEYLNLGANRDGKRTLSAVGRGAMRMLVADAAIPRNFVADLDPIVRERIMSQPSGQRRVRALFHAMLYTPIPRLAIETVARERDPFRRTRADSGDPLEGVRALNGKQQRAMIEELGLEGIAADEWIAVPSADIDNLRYNR